MKTKIIEFYKIKGAGKNKRSVIDVDSKSCNSNNILYMNGWSWVDVNYGLILKKYFHFKAIITDTDLIARDDYMENMANDILIVIFTNKNKDVCAASEKRQKNAYLKLKTAGCRVIYRASLESAIKAVK